MRDIVLEETFYHDFTTRAFATGIPTVLAGTPVLSVLEENNATPITAGVSVSVDRASVVGLNMATIAATAANGYESGKGYSIYISTGTVGGVSVVGEVVGQFTIDASAAAQDLANGTDGLGAIKGDTAAILVDTGTDIPARFDGVEGATFATGTDSLEAIRNRGDAEWITATGFAVAGDAMDLTAQGVDDIWDEVLDSGSHNVNKSAGKRIRDLQESGAVYNGQVWVDTVNGNAGTESYVNGTSDNHVNLWASAITISNAVGLPDFHIINGSTITFAENNDNHSLFGDNYTLDLSDESCVNIYVQGATVSGAGLAATGEMHFEGCEFGTASVQGVHTDFCGFTGTVTQTLAGDYKYHNSYAAGTATPVFTKTAAQTITGEWWNWAGNITISTIESGDVITIGGTLGVITLNGADGTVAICGTYASIVDNRTGSPVTDLTGAVKGDDVAAILDDTGTTGVELTANAVDDIWDEVVSKAAHDVGQSAAKFLRQGADLVQIDGAVSDVSPSVTGFDTNLTQVDTYFDDAVLIFSNGSANAGIGKPVVTYVNANGNMTFLAPDDWPVTPVNGDDFVIFATHEHPISQIQASILSDATPFQGADIPLILADTNDLQTNQGNWLTLTGAATEAKQDTIDANVDAIKVVTDSMNFTIAGIVDCNIQYVNDQIVTGDGGVGTEWQGA